MISACIVTTLTLGTSAVASAGESGESKIDLKKTTLQWTGQKVVGDKHTGKLSLKSAKVVRKDGKLQSAELVVDIASIDVEDLKGEWKTKLEGHLASADFFEVEKYPTATLVLDSQVDGDTVAGKLTIKGKSQPIQVDYKEKSKGVFTGTMTFDRTKFGVVYGSGSFFKGLGDKVIADQITVDFTIHLTADGERS
jgi:polyisoprenoid-binding protein YceI